MNRDGVVTISDVWLWFKWLYFYPGDVVLEVILKIPGLATFLEVSDASFGGSASGIMSAPVWGFVWLMIWASTLPPVRQPGGE